jgi:hypothetical protein
MSKAREQAEQIKRLESEVYRLQHELVTVAPDEFIEILRPRELLSDFNPYRWLDEAAPRIIAKTVPLHGIPDRAPCPLCNSHPEQHEGYALPAGLARHLSGKLGQRQCYVMKAALTLLTDQWNRTRQEKST